MTMFSIPPTMRVNSTNVTVRTQPYQDQFIAVADMGIRLNVEPRDTAHDALDELQDLAEKMLWAIKCERNALDLASNVALPMPVEYRA